MDSVIVQIAKSIERTEGDAGRRGLHEAIQQVALAGLYRSGFFDRAAFYGGTCLRLFHGLDRFSEDLDFSLLAADERFDLSVYFDTISAEFSAYGCEIEIEKKAKAVRSQVESAFLKTNTEIYSLTPKTKENIRIKIEVDILPPMGFEIEPKLLLLPFSFYTPCFVLPDLFAGKMHALLFRKWKMRVKGRDWYDLEWYVRNGVSLGLEHFNARKLQSEGDSPEFSEDVLREALRERIDTLDVNQVREEVEPFVRDTKALEIWSRDYFLELANKLMIA